MATSPEAVRQVASRQLDTIENEMQHLGIWRTTPLAPEAYSFKRPFATDTMTFPEWLQFVFLPRAREVAVTGRPFPRGSRVATLAVREFDGLTDFKGLIRLLSSFESWIDSSCPT
jgi:uncharacterized protein YqcC (DUF446 family)